MGQRPVHRIISYRPRPWLRLAVLCGAGAVMAVFGVLVFMYARHTTAGDLGETRSEVEQLREERRELTRQLRTERTATAELRQQMVYVERSGDIDGQACNSVKESLAGLQAEAADLREQVAFYRGVVSPDETRAGVRVLDLRVAPQSDPQRWRYELVLIQSVRQNKRVSGTTQIRVIGSRDGKQATLDLEKQLVDPPRLPTFAFKYFQELSGDFLLPAGFRPLRVAISLAIEGDASKKIEEEYDWSKIQQQKAPS